MLTIVLSNPTGVAMTDATFTDVFPTSPGAMTVAAPLTRTNGCSALVNCVDSRRWRSQCWRRRDPA